MKISDNCIEDLENAIGEIVSALSFHQISTELIDMKRFNSWVRIFKWKKEWVEIVSPATDIVSRPYAEIILRVRLLFPDGRECLFDGINIRDINKKSGSYYYIPASALPGSNICKRFVREIAGDLRKALHWFSDYATPEACLNRLKGGETSLGPIQTGKPSARAQTFLSDLPFNRDT